MTGPSDWQTDGGKDRNKTVKNPSGCETWANGELKQSMTILFYSPLSTWAPGALCDVCVCVCACCVPVCLLSSACTPESLGGDERREGKIEETLRWAVPPLRPCMQCDFCFMACGCIKPQSNNLVSSGAETTDISHGATVLHCICEPQRHAAVHCHFTSSFYSFFHSLFQQLSATSLCDRFYIQCIYLLYTQCYVSNPNTFLVLVEISVVLGIKNHEVLRCGIKCLANLINKKQCYLFFFRIVFNLNRNFAWY